MVDLLGAYAGMFSNIKDTMTWLFPMLLVLGVVIVIFLIVRERKIYKYPVTIISERESQKLVDGDVVRRIVGTSEFETRGGIVGKGSAQHFVIKLGWVKKKPIYKLPTFTGMTGNNRLYFYQKNPDTFIQMKRAISRDIIKFEPIESDVKYGAILSIQSATKAIGQQSKWERYAPSMIIFVGLAIIMIMFYMLLQKFDPGVMASIAEDTARAAEALKAAR